MQVNYSEISGHVLAHRSASMRDFAHVNHERVHPLREGFQMMASFVVLTASLGVMYVATLIASDFNLNDTFSHPGAMTALERPVSAFQR